MATNLIGHNTDDNFLDVKISCHYSEAAGSDAKTIRRIQAAITRLAAFGLKCSSSMVVYLPNELKCYWMNKEGKVTNSFDFPDMRRLMESTAMQYLSHKEFVSTKKLAELATQMKRAIKPKAKIILLN